MVTSDGMEVEAFGSAEEFLAGGDLQRSACLILDVNLPGMSGHDLQERLNRSGRSIPVIFMSALADELTRERSLKAGAVDFLSKPFGRAALLAAIRSALPA